MHRSLLMLLSLMFMAACRSTDPIPAEAPQTPALPEPTPSTTTGSMARPLPITDPAGDHTTIETLSSRLASIPVPPPSGIDAPVVAWRIADIADALGGSTVLASDGGDVLTVEPRTDRDALLTRSRDGVWSVEWVQEGQWILKDHLYGVVSLEVR